MKSIIILCFLFISLSYSALISEDVVRQLSLNGDRADIFIELKEQINFDSLVDIHGTHISKMNHIAKGRFIVENVSRKICSIKCSS